METSSSSLTIFELKRYLKLKEWSCIKRQGKMSFIRKLYANFTNLGIFIMYTIQEDLTPYLLELLVVRTDVRFLFQI